MTVEELRKGPMARWIGPAVLLLAMDVAQPGWAAGDATTDKPVTTQGTAGEKKGAREPRPEPGDAAAAFELGQAYDEGRGVILDWPTAVKWYRVAAEQGHVEAQYHLGLMYEGRPPVPKDYAEAAKWHRRAAEQGHVVAQRHLASMYEHGLGVPQDYAEAAGWYRKAANQGDPFAQGNLSIMYELGQGLPQDDAEAARWQRKAAEQGYVIAQYLLAYYYAGGHGVPLDYAEAALWYRKVANNGLYVAADFGLGFGAGLPKDQAAKLGIAYWIGIPQEYTQAMKWVWRAADRAAEAAALLREAADRADGRAQADLALLYELGWGVPKDNVQAYMWNELALAHGFGRAATARDSVAGHMTPAMIEQAKALVAAWKPTRGL
jgi:TPR repeat protein